MKKWEVFAVQNVAAAEEIIDKLVSEGYEKEDISVLAKSKHNKNLETLAEKENIEIERPVNEEAFGIISGILQSLSGAIVIPQATILNMALYMQLVLLPNGSPKQTINLSKNY